MADAESWHILVLYSLFNTDLFLCLGVSSGSWFYEVLIKSMPEEDCAMRVGWAQASGMFALTFIIDKNAPPFVLIVCV